MYTLLSLVQEFTGRRALAVPQAVYGSSDPQVIQMMRILEATLDALTPRGRWQELTVEASWTTLAQEDQGDISSTIATNGFNYLLPDTFWDRTNKIALVGPMGPSDWQALKAWVVTGPRYTFRLRQNRLIVTPAPTAGLDWRFEYISRNAVRTASAPYTYRLRFAADTDVILLPEEVVMADFTWRWKKEKGISYAEDFATAEALIVNAVGRSGGKPVLRMDQSYPADAVPGISVPLFTNITP